MKAPFISVILPTRDRAGLLPRAIASVLNQGAPDLEVIVVDDASTDGTRELITSFSDHRIVYVRNEIAGGDAAARNSGAARARGTWLAFQDSDDEWVPHKLAMQMPVAAAAGAGVALVASSLVRMTPRDVEVVAWPISRRKDDASEIDRDAFAAGFSAYLQSVLIRRSAFEALGGFDAQLKARSDFELCLRLLQGHRGLALREILAVSYESADGLSQRPDLRRDDIRHILARHGDTIARDRSTHARYLYDLAKAEVACNHRHDGLRAAARSLQLDPWALRTWVLLALAPFSAPGLRRTIGARRRLREALR